MGALGFGAELAVGRWRTGVAAAAPLPGFDFTAGTMPAGASLTRGSAGMRIDVSGALTSEAAHVARFDFDPATHALLGLLVEPARTNSLLQSAAFASTDWTAQSAPGSIAVNTNAGTGPTGSMDAERLDLPAFNSADTGSYAYLYQPVTLTANRMLSFWLRGASGGEKVTIAVSGGGARESVLVTLTAGWQRYSMLSTMSASTIYPYVGLIGGDGNVVSVGAQSIYAWGAQIEAGSTMTSTIATAASTASRSADALVLDWASKGVADGAVTVRYTFDDLSTQDAAATVAGGVATVPTTLNRARLRRAAKV